MKFLSKKPIRLEAQSTMRDILDVFLKTIDGLYVLFWTIVFWIFGLLAIVVPSLNIQKFSELALLFLTPVIMSVYMIWFRLGNSLVKKSDLAIALVGISVWAVVPFYKFLFG